MTGNRVLLPALAIVAAVLLAPRAGAAEISMSGLHVAANQVLNGGGQVVFIHGVNRSGAEYACIQGWGIFDGPADQASISAIKTWNVNAVRVPLNEDCWLGINSSSPYIGQTYRDAIIAYVNLITSNNLAVILDLHWNAPGTQSATGQMPMLDLDHAPAFWTSVANTFKSNSSVLFDLHNEPYPDNNQDTAAAWTCWRDGRAACPGLGYTAVGMQELLNTVRATGATNVVMLGGVEYSGTLSQWLNYRPSDSLSNIAASWHMYDFGGCTNSTCWNSEIAPVTAQFPIVMGEVGSTQCSSSFMNDAMAFIESKQQGYLAWTWDTWGTACGNIALISDYSGTPTQYGAIYRNHIAGLSWSHDGAPPPPPPPPPGEAVQNGGFDSGSLAPWQLLLSGGARGSARTDSLNKKEGSNAAAVTVLSTNANSWYVQLAQGQVPLRAGYTYTISFWAKASAARTAQLAVQQGVAPYATYFAQNLALTTGWKKFSYSFTPAATTGNALFVFNLAQSLGAVWIDSVSMK